MPNTTQQRKSKLGLTELIAIGVGGMIGGGIFSVLGMAVSISGHAAPLAFALGSLIALAAGYSYVRLTLAFRRDGASYTYLERAFPGHPVVGALTGWLVIFGYVGTLALYAFTFGAYGGDLLGSAGDALVRMVLAAAVLLFFMLINMRGVRTSGQTADLIVYSKIILLGLFAVVGLFQVKPGNFVPLLDQGPASVFMAGALIFVAYEGFQLITNTVEETRNPERNIPMGIYGSIVITSLIYVTLAVVAIGNLTPQAIIVAEEYALAEVARPILGNAGIVLVDVAALLATSSAINSTLLGASHMMAEMSADKMMPAFLGRRTMARVPWSAVLVLTLLGLIFALVGGLTMIAAFSSMTFLLVSIGVSIANLRLHKKTGSRVSLVILGIGLMLTTVVLLLIYLLKNEPVTLALIALIYVVVAVIQQLYSRLSVYSGERRRKTTGKQ